MNTILDLEYQKCVGCTACASICPANCIAMEQNMEGFWYPSVFEDKCVQCGKCYKVCPIRKISEKYDKPTVFGMINKNIEVRNLSSSGGVFYELADAILTLERQGAVCGAGFDADMNVRHMLISHPDEIKLLTKSKYVQSDLNTSFIDIRELLNKKYMVLFVGTPCQVYALSNFLEKDYDNLYLVDLICHGVPSPKVWKEYIGYLEKTEKSKCKAISFRDISMEGWKNFGMRVEFENGKVRTDTQNHNIYMFGFLNGYTVRESCFECQFKGKMRRADLTIGDFWSVDQYLDNFNDNRGTSLVYVNTEKGAKMIEMIKDKFYINKVTTDDTDNINTAYNNSIRNKQNRVAFFEKYVEGISAHEILSIMYERREK